MATPKKTVIATSPRRRRRIIATAPRSTGARGNQRTYGGGYQPVTPAKSTTVVPKGGVAPVAARRASIPKPIAPRPTTKTKVVAKTKGGGSTRRRAS